MTRQFGIGIVFQRCPTCGIVHEFMTATRESTLPCGHANPRGESAVARVRAVDHKRKSITIG